MWLMIEAVDVWMFRDGKPFNSGEGHVAVSMFPPLAFTVQGMLRNFLIEHDAHSLFSYRRGENTTLSNQIGDPQALDLGQFTMAGPHVACWDETRQTIERYFPLPADVFRTRQNVYQARAVMNQSVNTYSDLPVNLNRLTVYQDEEEPEPLWLPESLFESVYLKGNDFGSRDCLHQDDLFVYETRTGISKDYSLNTVQDGLLYSAYFIRPQAHVGLLVQVDDALFASTFPNEQTIHYAPLGGEGRLARLQRVDSCLNTYPYAQPTQQSKVVLTTPAYLSSPLQLNGLTAVAFQRPLKVGGWDVVNSHPRPIRSYLPAGSVFYFKNNAPSAPLTEDVADMPSLKSLGFGDFLIGTWSYAND